MSSLQYHIETAIMRHLGAVPKDEVVAACTDPKFVESFQQWHMNNSLCRNFCNKILMEKQYEPPVDMKDVNKAGKFHIPVQEVGNEVTYKEVTKDQYTMFNALNQKSMEMKYKLETMAKQIKKEHNLDFDPIEIATSANALQKHEEKCLAKLNQQQGQQQTPTKSGPAIG